MKSRFRIAQIFLFDTCTHKCAYCSFAESGQVLDGSQLRPYRDEAFVDQIADFFNKRTSEADKWTLTMTGGEPLLMPNFARLAGRVGREGNRIALYTAMLIGDSHPSLRYLMEEGAAITEYLMVSFHPEAEEFEDRFFARLERLKRAGHRVILRFVCHPARLHRMDELSEKCRAIDIAFYPTPLFSPDYPVAYTVEQRNAIGRHTASLSQIIQMENGLDTRFTHCWAGSKIISIDMRSGNITPCITVPEPSLGNIYDDRLDLGSSAIACPSAGIACICDTFFQQDIVLGAEDQERFEQVKSGYVQPFSQGEFQDCLESMTLPFSTEVANLGQTKTSALLSLTNDQVKAAYERSREHFAGTYAQGNHPDFKRRQFAGPSEDREIVD